MTALFLMSWHVVESSVAHPDYVAYFNRFVGAHDYRKLSGSNLGWGIGRSMLIFHFPERAKK